MEGGASSDQPRFRDGSSMASDPATHENWLRPPYVFWSIRHVREILPCAIAERPASKPHELDRDLRPELLSVRFDLTTGADVSVGDYLKTTQTDAMVVIKNNTIVLDWRAPLIGDNEPHNLFSVTKSLTGLLSGVLIGKGLIDPSQLAVNYVPELGESVFRDVTVRQLLDMEASFRFTEDYSPQGSDLQRYYKAAGYLPASSEEFGLHKYLLGLSPHPEEPTHGVRFRYLTPTTDVLAWVIEAACGEKYAKALSKYIWGPMGAEFDADIPVDNEGTARGSGGLSATPRDMARVGLIVARDGMGIVPKAFIDDLLTAGNKSHWSQGEFADWLPGGCYRSCWYQPRVDSSCMAVGIRGQMLYVDRARQVVVAKQSSWDDPDPQPMHKDAEKCCRAIAQAWESAKV